MYKKFRDLDGEENNGANSSERKCFQRAKVYHTECKNSNSQLVTATFRSTGHSFVYTRDDLKGWERQQTAKEKAASEVFRAKNEAADKVRAAKDKELEKKQFEEDLKKAEAEAFKHDGSNAKAKTALLHENDIESESDLAVSVNATQEEVENRLRAELHSLVATSHAMSDLRCRNVVRQALAMLDNKVRAGKPLVMLLVDLRKQLKNEQDKDDVEWLSALKDFHRREADINRALAIEKHRQQRYTALVRTHRNAIREHIRSLVRNHEEFRIAKRAFNAERRRCKKEEVQYSVRYQINQEEQLNIKRLMSLLRAWSSKKIPRCPAQCTDPAQGSCIFVDRYGPKTQCACEWGWWGEACQYKMCPGDGRDEEGTPTVFAMSDAGVCSDNGKCNARTGKCTCKRGYYQGPNAACEKHRCPGRGKCSGRGKCDTATGQCTCKEQFWGPGCEWRKCLGANNILHPGSSSAACNGHGACDPKRGTCSCDSSYYGKTCQWFRCPLDCQGRGTCNKATGRCECAKGYSGRSCGYRTCPENCGGRSRGFCDRLTGRCTCFKGTSGATCRSARACQSQIVSWWTSFDKKGWSTCSPGSLLQGLYRNVASCKAIYCLEMVRCAQPCEATGSSKKREVLELDNCYYADWYKSILVEGWQRCAVNYFLAGMYRNSSDSLYGIVMGLCCSVADATYQRCRTHTCFTSFNKIGWSVVTSTPQEGRFMTGLFRGRSHTLDAIDTAASCEFRREPWPDGVGE
jgi:hypothetical protein